MQLAQLRTQLAADAGVTAIVGARIYPVLVPEGAKYPALVLLPLSTKPHNALDGDAGLDLSHVIIDSLAAAHQDASRLRDAVRTALEADELLMLEETEDYDFVVRLYRISQQWQVWE